MLMSFKQANSVFKGVIEWTLCRFDLRMYGLGGLCCRQVHEDDYVANRGCQVSGKVQERSGDVYGHHDREFQGVEGSLESHGLGRKLDNGQGVGHWFGMRTSTDHAGKFSNAFEELEKLLGMHQVFTRMVLANMDMAA